MNRISGTIMGGPRLAKMLKEQAEKANKERPSWLRGQVPTTRTNYIISSYLAAMTKEEKSK